MRFQRLVAVLAVVVALGACALKGTVEVSMFKKEAKAAASTASDQQAVARLLLCAGISLADVEGVLRSNGLDAAQAHKVALLADAEKKCRTAEAVPN